MAQAQGIVVWLKRQYDKLVTLVVLAGLLLSLLYLAVHFGTIQSKQEAFALRIANMTPKFAEARDVETEPFQVALAEIDTPRQLSAWTNALFVPEERVTCVDCRQPIPFGAKVCPFCDVEQPPDPEEDPLRDLDADGMRDVWELAHGLNPRDPDDAELDGDDDGFTNLEEFMANPSTDPGNADDFPPIVAKLRLLSIEADPFRLRFKSVIKLPNGDLKFAINTRGNQKTYFRKLNEEVEGFTLESYEERFEEKQMGGVTRRVDVSVLTLARGDRMIPLVKGQDVQYNEYTAHLLFAVDNSRYEVRINQVLELNRKKYKVIAIDSRRESVVLRRLLDGKELEILKLPGRSGEGGSARRNSTGLN